MDVCPLWVLSGRGLCDKLITHREESYRLWCVVCDIETSRMRRPWPALGRSTTDKKKQFHCTTELCIYKERKLMLNACCFAILPKSGQTTPLISYTSTEEVSIWFKFCLHCFFLKSLLQHSSFFGYHIFPASFLPVSAQNRTGNLKFTGWRQEKVGEYRSVLICIYKVKKTPFPYTWQGRLKSDFCSAEII